VVEELKVARESSKWRERAEPHEEAFIVHLAHLNLSLCQSREVSLLPPSLILLSPFPSLSP